ncbi:MAG: creatininase family protein [Bacillota bacterium]
MRMLKLQELSWKEVDALERANTTFLLPIASTEQHGYHLPVSTDTAILEGMLEGLVKTQAEYGRRFVLMPLIPVGISPEHLDFPGTLSLSCATAAALIMDLLGSLARHGFKDFILVNSHGGNTPFLSGIGREIRERFCCGVRLLDVYGSKFFGGMPRVTQGTGVDIHGGEYETSILQVLRPELVHLDFPPHTLKSALSSIPDLWMTRELSETGVIGDATLATPQKGQAFYAFAVQRLKELLIAHCDGKKA